MSQDHNIGPVDQSKGDAFRWACAMGRLAGGHHVGVIWDVDFKPHMKKSPKLKDMVAGLVMDCVNKNGGNKTAAAQQLQCSRHTINSSLKRIGAMASCVLLLVGCASKPAVAVRAVPPVPSLALARSSSSTIKSSRIDSSLIVAPHPVKLVVFKWNGPTNGWVHVVGRKETLFSPWQEYARVTNRTECTVIPGFYTVLRMEDTDLPGHVWVRR